MNKKEEKPKPDYSQKALQTLEEQRRKGQLGEAQKLWQQEQDKLYNP